MEANQTPPAERSRKGHLVFFTPLGWAAKDALPAVVTSVHDGKPNLHVFTDAAHPSMPRFVEAAEYSADGKPGTWCDELNPAGE